jgi:hypothetical protein
MSTVRDKAMISDSSEPAALQSNLTVGWVANFGSTKYRESFRNAACPSSGSVEVIELHPIK